MGLGSMRSHLRETDPVGDRLRRLRPRNGLVLLRHQQGAAHSAMRMAASARGLESYPQPRRVGSQLLLRACRDPEPCDAGREVTHA